MPTRLHCRPHPPALLLLALALAAGPRGARAEVALADSVEWLGADAARVVVGRIVSFKAADPSAQGKNQGLALATVRVAETLKGAGAADALCVGLRHVDERRFESYRKGATDLVFFLGTSIQATSFEGRVCNHWPLRGGDALPAIVPLDAPGTRLLSATTFKVLRQRGEALAATRDALRRLAAAAGSPPKPAKRAFLEVPIDSEVYKLLYSGSACYLHVPDLIFPKARPRLGR
jgi:hypothetical protein